MAAGTLSARNGGRRMPTGTHMLFTEGAYAAFTYGTQSRSSLQIEGINYLSLNSSFYTIYSFLPPNQMAPKQTANAAMEENLEVMLGLTLQPFT